MNQRITDIDYLKKSETYAMQMRPVFRSGGLFSDETENYVSPMEPEPGDTVTIRFRTVRNNIDYVYWISDADRILMDYEKTEGIFDYYKIEIIMGTEIIHYYFEVRIGKIYCFYNKRGVSRNLQEYYAFSIAPGFKTPQWAKGAVMYQIMVDRFRNGDPTNTVEDGEYFYIGDRAVQVKDWNKYPDGYPGILRRRLAGRDRQDGLSAGAWCGSFIF